MKLFISISILSLASIAVSFAVNNVSLAQDNPNFRNTHITNQSDRTLSLYSQFPLRRNRRSSKWRSIGDRDDREDRRENLEEICERRWDEDDWDDCREEAREDREDKLDDRRDKLEERRDLWD